MLPRQVREDQGRITGQLRGRKRLLLLLQSQPLSGIIARGRRKGCIKFAAQIGTGLTVKRATLVKMPINQHLPFGAVTRRGGNGFSFEFSDQLGIAAV